MHLLANFIGRVYTCHFAILFLFSLTDFHLNLTCFVFDSLFHEARSCMRELEGPPCPAMVIIVITLEGVFPHQAR